VGVTVGHAMLSPKLLNTDMRICKGWAFKAWPPKVSSKVL